jgi:hypothetical protein
MPIRIPILFKHCRMSQRGIEEICPGHHGHEAGSSIVLLAVPLVKAFAKGLYSLLGGVDPSEDNHGQYGQFDAAGVMTYSYGNAYRGQYPYAGGGGDAYNNAVAGENDAGAKEPYARDDLADQAKIDGRLVVEIGERREYVGADTNQDACSDADGFA